MYSMLSAARVGSRAGRLGSRAFTSARGSASETVPAAGGAVVVGLSALGALGALGLAIQKACQVPCAVHEAGHTILALHVAERGLACSEGRLVLHGCSSTLLKYVTITPRFNGAKSTWYLGETKLSTRWRHMHEHARWVPFCAASVGEGEPQLRSDDVAHRCEDASSPHAVLSMLVFARIAYLLGGCVPSNLAPPAHRHVHTIPL